jgi:osmotically-inducible protein OsmY
MMTGGVIAAEMLWVVSEGAKLKADRSASSETIEELPVGSELTADSSEGSWYKVTTKSNKAGWIYRGKVSSTQPEAKGDQGGGGLFGVMPGSSIKASAADTSRSIRGLSPAAKEYATRTKTPEEYQKALDRVLALRVTDQEIEGFLREGKIGEYSK